MSKVIKPGPWTNICTKLKVKASLKPNISFSERLGVYWGVYRDTANWKEAGTYPIVFNITAPNLTKLLEKYDLDEILAACEKALNNINEPNGKPMYGKIVLLKVMSNQAHNPKRQFISCIAKTTKKRIKGFMSTQHGKLKVIKY